MKQFIRQLDNVFTINNDVKINNHILFCRSRLVRVNCDRKSQVTQHINTGQHNNSLKNLKTTQITIQDSIAKSQNEFNRDLCKFLVSLNISFNKLLNTEFKSFIEKYTKYRTPNPSSLWKSNLEQLYNGYILIVNICKQLEEQYIYISIDETTDCDAFYLISLWVHSIRPLKICQTLVEYGVFG
jgi:hypothetical protein